MKWQDLDGIRRADDLEAVIQHLDTLYEEGQDCVVSIGVPSWLLKQFNLKHWSQHPGIVTDSTYDMMRNELKTLRPDSLIFAQTTASQVDSGIQKIQHHPPLTSIEKASHEDLDVKMAMLKKWIQSVADHFHISFDDATEKLVQAYKLDGVALGLYYEKGKLVAAGLRPRDGVNGEEVTIQTKHVPSIPQKLKLPVTCSIRGELICRLSDFDKVQAAHAKRGEPLKANPRNHAAGAIRQFKEPKKTANGKLSFIGYSIENLDNPPYKSEIERAKWANKKLGIRFVQVRPFRFDDLKMMEDGVEDLDYEVDGIVVSVGVFEDQEQLGRHGDKITGNPRGKIAYKFAEEHAEPVIKAKEWFPGRTGAIKPVAVFDAVSLAGTQVRRATLHNLGFMMRNKIDVGTKIKVLKAGKIIPKVVGVISGQKDPDYPKYCPSCGGKTTVRYTPASGSREEMHELVCPHGEICPAQNINRMCHFLSTLGVLGLGDSRVEQLLGSGEVKMFADFFDLTEVQAMKCGLSERQSLLVIAAIHMISNPEKVKDNNVLRTKIDKTRQKKKLIPLWKFFAAFGIPTAGTAAGKALMNNFDDFDAIRNATVDELSAVDDIGKKTADIIRVFFDSAADMIDALLEHIELEMPKKGKLTGKAFCFSGGFQNGKRYWEQKVESLGGICKSGVGRTTDFLVTGEKSGSKSAKAKELGVPTIDVDELEKML